MRKDDVIEDVTELIVQATGDETEHLKNASSITLADLQTIYRALQDALRRKPAGAVDASPSAHTHEVWTSAHLEEEGYAGLVVAGNKTIAMVLDPVAGNDRGSDAASSEAIANLRLITVAPKLLSALQFVAHTLGKSGDFFGRLDAIMTISSALEEFGSGAMPSRRTPDRLGAAE